MLHTKFHGNRPTGSGDEDFLRVFIMIHWCSSHLGHVTKISRRKFQWHYPRRLRIKFQVDWPSGFREDL